MPPRCSRRAPPQGRSRPRTSTKWPNRRGKRKTNWTKDILPHSRRIWTGWRRWATPAKVLVTVGVLGALAASADWPDILRRMSTADPALLITLALRTALARVFDSVRMLRYPVPFKSRQGKLLDLDEATRTEVMRSL